MSQEIDKILFDGLTIIGEDIANSIRELGLDDTGASQQFEIEFSGSHVRLLGVSYLEYLVYGRGPGKFPPVDRILDYVRRNNISITFNGVNLNEQQTAYLIGKGISEQGTRIYRGEVSGVPLAEILEQGLTVIMERIADQAIKQVTTALRL